MVAMNVWPTDAADGSVANEARWRSMGRLWMASGVASGFGGDLAPSLVAPNLTVAAGACWVDGHYCELLGSQVLTVTANGLAVVRFDPAANTAELLYLDGVTTPTQSPTGTWELPIASIAASALTDVRALIAPSGDVTFPNLAARDLNWPNPPNGEHCWIPFTGFQGGFGLHFIRSLGSWRPLGTALHTWAPPNQAVADDTDWTIAYTSGQTINILDAYDGASGMWHAPFTGTVKVSAGIGLSLGSAAGGADVFGDFDGIMGLHILPVGLYVRLAQFKGRFALATLNGWNITQVSAGDTVRPFIQVAGAIGYNKTALGSPYNQAAFIIEYI